jgi:hypothetical protein
MRRLVLAALAASLVAGPAIAAQGCPTGLKHATTAELYFGKSIGPSGEVSQGDWRAFLDAEVTPRFPDGLTVTDVYGQWKTPRGEFVREASSALFLVLAGAPDEQQRIDLIRAAYKRRFQQDSVLLVEQAACVSF